jgi:hypothetical protein
VRVSDVRASLPFSTLTLRSGTLRFTPESGFDPVLEIRGSAEPRPYRVNVYVYGRASDPQLKMLWLLYESQGQVVSRPELVAVVWGDEQAAGVSDQALDALIRRLRDRLASLDPLHQYISTVRGHGVRLDNPPA